MLITAKIEGMPYLMFELYCHIAITYVIKTITKFSNVIGYHQPDLSTEGQWRVMLVIGQFNGTVKGTIVVSHFADLTVVFNIKVQSLSKMF